MVKVQLTVLRNRNAGVTKADQSYEALAKRYEIVKATRSPWMAMGAILGDAAARLLRRWRLERELSAIKDAEARAQVAKLITQLAFLKRQATLLPIVQPLVDWWKAVHIPAAVLLAVATILHIVTSMR
jgi:hypothetical protein